MKTEQPYSRIAALTIVLLTVVNSAIISQGTDSRSKYVKEGKIYAGIVITPQITKISNNDFFASSTLNQKGGTSLGFALEGGYFFSKIAGISIGAGMGSYSTELSMDSCSIKFQATDSDLEVYEMRIKGKLIKEEQKLSFLNIPVCVVMKIPAGDKLGFYVKAGLSFNIPIVKTYKGSGIFSYSGYYSAYPVLLQNIPAYFPSDVETSSSGNIEVKSFSQTLVASGGVTFKLNELIELALGLYFNKSLGNISTYKPDSNFRLTSKANELNSFMAGSSKAGVQAFGLSLGLKYYLR